MVKLRVILIWAAVLVLIGASPMAVAAAQPDMKNIDSRILVSAPLGPTGNEYKLVVQATSLPHEPYYYVISLSNLTPWKIEALQLRDRYLSLSPATPELTRLWLPEPLLPGEATAIVLMYDEGAFSEGCHQLEISLADGLFTVLMDCSTPGSTTIWEVPLTAEMEAFLALPPLTQVTSNGHSKAGLHVARNADPAVMAFVRAAQPSVVVAMDDLDWLREVKQISPSTITIGRMMESEQVIFGDPLTAAQRFVSGHTAQYLANPGIDYWLGWNEPDISSPDEMTWYAAFEAERVRLMAQLGFKAAIGNFSTGVPEANEFAEFLPAVAAAKEYGGILALHEYSAPSLRDGVDSGIPGLADIDGAGALTLRYRFWYDHYLRPQNLIIPLVVTEAGIDGGVLPDAEGKGGWRDWLDDGRLGESTPEAVADYLEQLSWYDDELRRDPYVLGFAIFNAGTPDGRWSSFDITEILPQLAGMINSKG